MFLDDENTDAVASDDTTETTEETPATEGAEVEAEATTSDEEVAA
jgi:hypothetical protein